MPVTRLDHFLVAAVGQLQLTLLFSAVRFSRPIRHRSSDNSSPRLELLTDFAEPVARHCCLLDFKDRC